MTRFAQALLLCLKIAVGVLTAALIVPVTLQVLGRQIPAFPSMLWTEEVARALFVWVVMLGAVLGVAEKSHFDVNLLPEFRSPRARLLGDLFVTFSIAVVAFFFLVWGIDYARFGAIQRSTILGISLLWTYAAVPISGGLWLFFLMIDAAKTLRALAAGGKNGTV